MPRASSKRKSSAPQNPPAVKSSNARSGKAKAKEIENFFDKYANGGIIDPDGIVTLCKDLELEYTECRILMLAWKLKAVKLGYFTQDEWETGLKTLQVNNLSKLKKAISRLEKEVFSILMEFWCSGDQNQTSILFAFRYHLTGSEQLQGNKLDQWLVIFRICNDVSEVKERNSIQMVCLIGMPLAVIPEP
ncbi:hypothetical protein CUMW_174110 [Citrus unshiu]|uniref:Defective in cullin neddylation protein n=1 Tax=Citrus unshiu TaxID=55188 RepID=A0A2H5PWI3_CITUN|nr:hypothetical protein CUMW_174110 [Citrus unshiu]